MSDIVVRPITKIKKKCLCCGQEMELYPYIEQDFCDRCFIVVCRNVFNKKNDKLAIEQLREKIKGIIEEKPNDRKDL